VLVHPGGKADGIRKPQSEQFQGKRGSRVKHGDGVTKDFVPADPAERGEGLIVNFLRVLRK
jgi:hypothetical protein